MKKFLALLLALCLVLAAVPVLAESAAEEAAQAVVDETAQEVAEQAAEIIAADEAAAETDEGEPVEPEKESLSTVLSGLLDQVSDTLKDENGLGGVIDRLADDLGRETGLGDLADQLKEGGKQLGGLVAGLNNTLKENGQSLDGLLSLLGSEPVQDGISKAVDEAVAGLSEANLTPEELGSLLKDLLSGGGLGGTEGEAEAAELTEEDMAALEELANTLERAEKTGVPELHMKQAEGLDEFLGDWLEVQMYVGMDPIDMTDSGEGVRISETGYYVILNGEPEDPEYQPYANAQMEVVDGVLVVTTEKDQTTFVLTEEGNLVLGSDVFQIYYSKVQ